ncbi:MAG TPA: histidine kinase [Casimicrobiaceae bacterium]|nr:histidine kinase [Casimicrobiaceae bacterium]
MSKTTTLGAPLGQADCAPYARHPLELIPFFRRFRRTTARGLLYTLIFNSMFALVFALLALIFNPEWQIGHVLWANFVIANCIGFLIHGGFEITERLAQDRIARLSFAARTVYYSGVSIVGVFVGYWLGFTLLDWRGSRQWLFSAQGATSILILTLIISAVLALMFHLREREARAEAAFQRERARVEASEHQFHLAQLKRLEAQVEPHFLYNTLANVISLVDAQPSAAKRMLERLIDYLRHAAVAGDGAEATLGRQVDLLRAYLDLMTVRMGSRLAYRVEIPADLSALPLPPMLLQPLVENAIKHGLEPKLAGGTVSVSARREGASLVLTVTDDGEGFPTARPGPASGGLGLANVRERLASLYGERARLVIEDRQPGTAVTLALPIGAER